MSDREVFNLPVPHIHCDGSVSQLNIVRYANREWLGINTSDRCHGILVQDATHARALARALTVAADLLDANPEE